MSLELASKELPMSERFPDISKLKFKATITRWPAGKMDGPYIDVKVEIESGITLDSMFVTGWALNAKSMKLAERLKRAVEGGVIVTSCMIAYNIRGHSYLSATTVITRRIADSQLKKLGF